MKYDVWLTEQAERELHAAADCVWEHSPNASEKWFNGFVEALQSLEFLPERCPYARENPSFPFELRQLLYGKHRLNHRALFTINEHDVWVIAIRHRSQSQVSPRGIRTTALPIRT